MMHAPHTTLPGYHPAQVWHDGCEECEDRGKNLEFGIAKLDGNSFTHAWERAAQLQLHGLDTASRAELPLLRTLAMIQVQLERRGVAIGEVPGK